MLYQGELSGQLFSYRVRLSTRYVIDDAPPAAMGDGMCDMLAERWPSGGDQGYGQDCVYYCHSCSIGREN